MGMSRAILAAVLFLGITLTGCMDDGPDDDVAPEAPDPSASFDATPVNGSTPLLVNFSITFNDMDGRAVTWSLDADGDGTADADGSIQQNDTVHHEHAYTQEGTYNASARWTLNGTTSTLGPVVITVQEGYTVQTVDRSGVIEEYADCQQVEDYADDGFVPDAGEDNDTDGRIDLRINASTHGQTYEVRWSFNASFHEVHTFLTTKNGTVVRHATEAGVAGTDIVTHGTVHRDAYWAVLFACGGEASYEFTYASPRPET